MEKVIIALIVGASGLGVGLFSIIRYEAIEGPQGPTGLDGLNGIDGVNGTLDNLVAIWDNLTGIGTPSTSFFIGLYDIQLNNSEYFSLSGNNINVQLTKVGWYRFTIRLLWSGTISGIDYRLYIYKNSFILECLAFVYYATTFYSCVDSFVYAYSDGDDIFAFQCYTPGATPFWLHAGQEYNQLVLEYVGEIP